MTGMTAGVGHLHTLVCALSFLSGQRCGVEGIRVTREMGRDRDVRKKTFNRWRLLSATKVPGASRLGADKVYNRAQLQTISIIRTRTTLCSNTKLAIRNT